MSLPSYCRFIIDVNRKVRDSGKPNYLGCRIPIPSNFNFEFLEHQLKGYSDRNIVQFLKFGFPLGHDGKTGSKVTPGNHLGARNFTAHMEKLLHKEIDLKAAIGLFKRSPFGNETYLSPLNSVPKKDSEERRLILDLSHPSGSAMNDGIDKDWYMGEFEKLSLPSVDALADRIMKLGVGCRVFKVDLKRGYRQIGICPGSVNWLGYKFNDLFYFDTTLSMGSKSSAKCCQKVTNMVVYIYTKWGFFAINYLDDLGSAETKERADIAFDTLIQLLHTIGLQEAVNKCARPSTLMVFLGIQVDTLLLTLTIPQDKWLEIVAVAKFWLQKVDANLKETQKLAGLFNFACRCVKSGRIYLSRVLNFLRSFKGDNTIRKPVHRELREDISWWVDLAHEFNGISLLSEIEWSKPDAMFSSDSCMEGGGAYFQGNYIHWSYPKQFTGRFHINELECLMVIVALKTWGHLFHRKKMVIQCDNMVTVQAINSGSSRNEVLQHCLREMHKTLTVSHCQVKAVFIESETNRISDALSRFGKGVKFKKLFQQYTEGEQRKQWVVKENTWQFIKRFL